MRLISLHIENFGKLHDLDMNFTDGVNVIVRDNGWGKSTLTAFITVMFYGFDGERKRSELDNERRRYAPWNGSGVYGGSIVFETEKGRYRLDRLFGRTNAKDDSCRLYDAETNIEESITAASPGGMFFGIDRDSFRRTVCVNQNSCVTVTNGEISARIGQISDDTADMGSYDEAMSRLKAASDSMTPGRRTGELHKIRDRIAVLEEETGQQEELSKRAALLAGREEELKNDLSRLTGQRNEVSAQMDRLGRYKDIQVKKQQYVQLKKERDDAAENRKAIAAEKAETGAVGPGPSGYIPDDGTCADMISLWQKRVSLAGALAGKRAALRTCRDFLRRNEEAGTDAAGGEEFMQNESAPRKKSRAGAVIMIIFGCLLLALVPWLYLVQQAGTAASLCTAAGFVLLILGTIVFGARGRHNRRAEEKAAARTQQKNQAAGDIARYREQYRILNAEIREDTERIERADETVSAFLGRMQVTAGEDEVAEALYEIRKDAESYREQSRSRRNRLADAEDRLSKKEEALRRFEQENAGLIDRIESADAEVDDGSVEELNRRMKELSGKITETGGQIAEYERQHEQTLEDIDALMEKRDELAAMREKQASLQKQYETITTARDLLEKAYLSFTSKYMRPVEQAFEKYYNMLVPDDDRTFSIDAHLETKVRESGADRDTEFLSEGYQDVIGLCRRLAMADAMYPGEKPFLILDDPFESLDDAKISRTGRFLEEVGRSWQVLYLTCHGSHKVL